MANPEHLKVLKQGAESWNKWRNDNQDITPELFGAVLSNADLVCANLSGANLAYAELFQANLLKANLHKANLTRTKLIGATLSGADISASNLNCADLTWTNLIKTNLSRANLSGANLTNAMLIGTNLANANLDSCQVYGISAWDLLLEDAIQTNLTISPPGGLTSVSVDDIEVAQFIYLLINNYKIRKVIETVTSKVVLILGRFSTERKTMLEALRNQLRDKNYVPVVFDFAPSAKRDLTETVQLLAACQGLSLPTLRKRKASHKN